jgi:hypothetical protein
MPSRNHVAYSRAPYKDIDQVMKNAKDLVEVQYVLKQFINVKGD